MARPLQHLRQLGDVSRDPPSLLLFLFWSWDGRRPNGGPGVIRYLIRDLFARRFVIVIEFLLPCSFFAGVRRFSCQGETFGSRICANAFEAIRTSAPASGMKCAHADCADLFLIAHSSLPRRVFSIATAATSRYSPRRAAVARHQVSCRSPARLILEIDVGELLAGGVADDVAVLAELHVRVIDRPRRQA